jgi:hypothetical protein
MSINNNEIIARLEKLEKDVAELKKTIFDGRKSLSLNKKSDGGDSPEINFSLNIRAFVKRYATNKSGPRKFILLLAYMAKGEVGKSVELNVIRMQWNKMSAKSLLGEFNRFYPNEAKTRGWADSERYGSYCLTDEWEKAYEENYER